MSWRAMAPLSAGQIEPDAQPRPLGQPETHCALFAPPCRLDCPRLSNRPARIHAPLPRRIVAAERPGSALPSLRTPRFRDSTSLPKTIQPSTLGQ
jgi:hypothetical protein